MDFDRLTTELESLVDVPTIAKNIHVMVVDHNTTSLMVLASQLEHKQYKVTTTESASVALTFLQQRKGFYNMVLANYHMPEMSAFVFTRKIRSRCGTMPVLLMATDVRVNIAVEALLRGVSFFFTKPLLDHDVTNLWQYVVPVTGKIPEPQNDNYYLDILRNGNLSSGVSSSGAQNGKRFNLKRNSPIQVNQPRGKNHVSEDLGDSSDSDEETQNNKRPRMCWSPSLHDKFLKAIEILGESKACPKAILNVMNEPGLTHSHVASHLQKYRYKKRNQDSSQAVEDQALPPIKLPTPVLNKVSQGQSLVPMVNYRAAPKNPGWLNGSSSVCYSFESVKQKLDAFHYSVNNGLISSGSFQVQASQGNGSGGQLAQGKGVAAELTRGINQNPENLNADEDQVPWFSQTSSHIAMTGDNVIVHPNPNQEQAQAFSLNFNPVTVTGDNAIAYTNPNRHQATGFPQNFGQATMTSDNVIPYSNPNGEQATGFVMNSGGVTMATTYMIPTGNQLNSGSNILNQGPASDFGMARSALGDAESFGKFGEWTMGENQGADNAIERMVGDYDIGYFDQIIQDFDAAGGVDQWDPFNL